jgi:hypothetical protein
MGKIENHVTFVKEQVAVQYKLARKYDDSPFRRSQHQKAAKGFSDLAEFLTEIQNKGTQDTSYLHRGDSPQKRISITYEDIDGAPEELIKELNLTEADKQDLLIEYMIAQQGGVLGLDKIMVELFKRTREVPKRNTIISRLYRMVGKGMIYNVPGKKGVYSTYELSAQEAKSMFGQSDGESDEPAAPAPTTTQASAPTPTQTTPQPRPAQASSGDKFRAQLMSSSAASGGHADKLTTLS